jgi:DnaJ like chaperone protein
LGRGFGASSIRQEQFLSSTFRIMGHVARSDGGVSRREITAACRVMQVLSLDESRKHTAMRCFRAGGLRSFNLSRELSQVHQHLHSHPQLIRFFMKLQLQAALMGNDLAPKSRDEARVIASRIGMNGKQYEQLEALVCLRRKLRRNGTPSPEPGTAQAQPNDAQNSRLVEQLAVAYQTLNVNLSDRDDDITRTYRRQLSRNHPDKLQAEGLSSEQIEVGNERTQEIRAAYNLIRAIRGMR